MHLGVDPKPLAPVAARAGPDELLGGSMATAPVVTPVTSYLFTFTELAGVTGSNFLHAGTRSASLSDDNNTSPGGLPPPTYTSSFVRNPNPPVLRGSIFVDIQSSTDTVDTVGTVDFDFNVRDKQLDFLRQGEVRTQNIIVTITDLIEGLFTQETITVQITGRNDKPTAHVDVFTINENVTVGKFGVLGNDTDPDLGDTKALTGAGFSVFSVTSAAAPYLTKAMVTAARINLTNNSLPVKNGIQLTLDKAFQGLATGENALIVVKYGMVDGFGATSASELRVTVVGSNDAQIVGSNGNDLFLFGEKDVDTIFALAGNDTVFPRGGNDVVFLGAGFDTVVFNTPLSAAGNKDTIKDFDHAQDTFKLENAVFTKLAAVGPLNPAFFRAGPAALDGNDYIVYNQTTGALSYDVNGSAAGGAIQFAFLQNKPALLANDFVVI
jgi:VCBS repeat-containing protein